MEQHHNQQTLGGISVHGTSGVNPSALPHLVPVNGGPVHHPGFGGTSKFSSTTLPKVHLPHHHHQSTTSSLLPGILKTNMLQPKTLHKSKIKVTQIKSSSYSRFYAKACNEWRDPSKRLSAWTTQFRRNVGDIVSDLTGPRFER